MTNFFCKIQKSKAHHINLSLSRVSSSIGNLEYTLTQYLYETKLLILLREREKIEKRFYVWRIEYKKIQNQIMLHLLKKTETKLEKRKPERNLMIHFACKNIQNELNFLTHITVITWAEGNTMEYIINIYWLFFDSFSTTNNTERKYQSLF